MSRSLLVLALLGLAAIGANAICESYVVAAEDTILSIAAKFNVKQDALEKAIAQCDATYVPGQSYLQVNQRICLPPTFAACQYVRTAGDNENCKYYVIQSGDTLENIALNLGLLRLDLEGINPEANRLQVNQFVKLTGWNDECPAPGDSQACRVYVAGAGDSLSAVAISFSVDVDQLKEVNPELAADMSAIIQPGMRVKIPPFTESCGEGVAVSKPVTGNCNAYTVAGGDTLYSVAAAFQTTIDLLTLANPGSAEGVLAPGTELFIPPYTPEDCVNGKKFVTPGQPLYTVQEGPAEQTTAPEMLVAAPTPAPAPAPASRRMKA